LFSYFETVVLIHFAVWKPNPDLKRRTQKFNYKSIDTFCFIGLTKSVKQFIRGVTERHCQSKWIFSQRRMRHLAFAGFIFCLWSRYHQLLFKVNLLLKDC